MLGLSFFSFFSSFYPAYCTSRSTQWIRSMMWYQGDAPSACVHGPTKLQCVVSHNGASFLKLSLCVCVSVCMCVCVVLSHLAFLSLFIFFGGGGRALSDKSVGFVVSCHVTSCRVNMDWTLGRVGRVGLWGTKMRACVHTCVCVCVCVNANKEGN